MPRPTKFRKVTFFPEHTYFVPLGRPKCDLEEVELKLEELEAMRLKDIEDLNQEECAERMQISRQTFQNIIDAARKKVAIALTEGKAVHIHGGNYTAACCRYTCSHCGHDYEVSVVQDEERCPACGSEQIVCGQKAEFCLKWCRRK